MYYSKVLHRNIVSTSSMEEGKTIWKIALGSTEVEAGDIIPKKAHQLAHREALAVLCPEVLQRFEDGIDPNALACNKHEVTMDFADYRQIRIDDYRIIPMVKLNLVNGGSFFHMFPVPFVHQLQNRLYVRIHGLI
jgi:hypothetical protein